LVVASFVLSFPVCAFAQEAQPVQPVSPALSIGGVPELIADKVKEIKAATLLTFAGDFGGAAYLPVWTFHAAQEPGQVDPMKDYVELGMGGVILEGGHGKAFLCANVNLPGVSARLWDNEWSKAHVRRSVFPPIWVGPYVRIPMPKETWVIGQEVGGMIAIRIGGGK
jgi:hypothetical protein